MYKKVQQTFTCYCGKHTNCIKLYCIKHESLHSILYFEVIRTLHMLEVRNIDMSLICFQLGGFQCNNFMSTKFYLVWLLNGCPTAQ